MVNCPELNWIQLSEHSKFGISFIFMEACKLWERHIQTFNGPLQFIKHWRCRQGRCEPANVRDKVGRLGEQGDRGMSAQDQTGIGEASLSQ